MSQAAEQKRSKARRAMEKEMTRSRSVVGRLSDGVAVKQDAERLMAEIPEDNRSLTGVMFGDPILNDPRCPWRPRVSA